MRYVRLAERADRNRNALPPPVRRKVTDKIVELATDPDPTNAGDVRLVAPSGINSGLILALVITGRYLVLIAYRIVTTRDEIWIEALERVYADDPLLPDLRGGPDI